MTWIIEKVKYIMQDLWVKEDPWIKLTYPSKLGKTKLEALRKNREKSSLPSLFSRENIALGTFRIRNNEESGGPLRFKI